jgi:hypothetical protein
VTQPLALLYLCFSTLASTLLTIEASPWVRNDFCVPFPSHFHPSSDADVVTWQDFMRRAERK